MKTFSFKAYLITLLLAIISSNVFSQGNSDEDNRIKIRLGFTSVNNLHRQILVTADSNATSGIDFGYDAENFENHIDDMYWMIENRKFLIQGIDIIDETTVLSLGLHTGTDGENIISIEELVNVPDDMEIGILDKETNIYHDFKHTSSISINLEAGEYLDRFELKFANDSNEDANNDDSSENTNTDTDNSNDNDTTSDQEEEEEEIAIVDTLIEEVIETESTPIELNFINRIKSISIKNIGKQIIKSVRVYNINGQQITSFNNINAVDQVMIQTYNINAGNYILVVTTDLGMVTKKVSVK